MSGIGKETERPYFFTEWAWVFSRTYYIRPSVEADIEAAIDQHLVRSLLRETNHNDEDCLGGEISPGGGFGL